MSDQAKDVLIIGAGPAGLQAAIHAVRKKATVLILGRPEKSSLFRAHVENYLCVAGVKEGSDLLNIALEQARGFGAEVLQEDVLQITAQDDLFQVKVESGQIYEALTLIFATGTSRKKLKVKGEKEFAGRGVSYCVDCDANFYRNLPVVIVGNESAAADGALTMLEYASEVFLVSKELSISKELHRKLRGSRVRLYKKTWIKEIFGGTTVEGVVLDNGDTLAVEGVFVELGAKGAIELAASIGVQLDMDTFTHIDTDKKQKTNITGIYAAGDITGHPYQMAKAVGEGCIAGWEAANYSLKLKRNAITDK